jgi:guanosine-3',5'-bis(diphosphate) 3'-pyrophosphohydrolase
MHLASTDELLAEIGLGNVISLAVARNLSKKYKKESCQMGKKLPIRGVEGMLITFAVCCLPIPEDPIIAHINAGKGLVVHHESCQNVRDYPTAPERFVLVEWDKIIEQDFFTEIKVDILNYQGALAGLTAVINTSNSDIQSLQTKEQDNRVYSTFIRLTAKNRTHLASIMRKIKAIPDVIKVQRYCSY